MDEVTTRYSDRLVTRPKGCIQSRPPSWQTILLTMDYLMGWFAVDQGRNERQTSGGDISELWSSRAITGPPKCACVAFDCSVLHDCDWIKDYATYATPKPKSCARSKAASRSIHRHQGMKHGHGPQSSEKTCNECDCNFLEWETYPSWGGCRAG